MGLLQGCYEFDWVTVVECKLMQNSRIGSTLIMQIQLVADVILVP